MPPVPEPEAPALLPFDDSSYSDEESLLLAKHPTTSYSNLMRDDSELTFSPEELQQQKQQSCHDETQEWWISKSLQSLWSSYYEALQAKPLLVKSITAFFLMGMADWLAQLVEALRYSNVMHMDWMRSFRFALFGLVGAPWTHVYYDWLDTVLPPTPEPWTWTTAIKVFIDQFIQAPILLALIIMGMSLMAGHGMDGMLLDMRRQYVSTLIQNWKLWIPATVINIAFVRPELRVLYDNLVFFGWTIILSMILNAPADVQI